MSGLHRAPFAIVAGACLLTAAPAQDLLHYKFDGGCGSTAINYAIGSPAPATGSIVTTASRASAWTTGRFGSALAGRTSPAPCFLDTGWAPALIGDISWACWLRQNPNSSTTTLTGLFGTATGGWWLVSNLLLTMGIGGSSQFNATMLLNLTQSGWTHVAFTADTGTQLATYYFNGVAQTPVRLLVLLPWASPSNVLIGRGNNFPNFKFDIDEFILVNRLLSAAEIAVLASDPRAAHAPFGASGGPRLLGNGQLPIPGNHNYGLVLNANPGLALAVLGSDYCSFGSQALPMDLAVLHASLAGVQWHVDADLGTLLFGLPSGATPIPLPLPNIQGLSGYSFFAQVLTLDTGVNRYLGSNAVAVGIGR